MRVHTAAACVAALFLAASVFGHTVALRLLLLAAGILLTSIALTRSNGEIRALPPIWVPFILWGAWAALSLMWSLEPERTWKEWRNEVFYTGAALWICFVGAQARNATRIFLSVVGAAVTTACLIALNDFLLGRDRYEVGWHGGPGDHSSALLTLMPCLAMAGWYANRARWPFWASACIWSLAALVFSSAYTTLNRTVWLGFAIQFVLLGALLLLRSEIPSVAAKTKRSKVSALALIVAAVGGSVVMLASIQAERRPMGVVKALEHESRLALWPEVIERIGERPITGYGFGRGMLRDSFRQQFGDIDIHLWHAHNLILEAMLQLGIPGLILLVLLLGAILHAGWISARNRDESAGACGIALVGVVAGMLIRNMTDTLLVRQNALLYWGVVGVLLGLAARSWRAKTPQAETHEQAA